jgi:hypothetical protein
VAASAPRRLHQPGPWTLTSATSLRSYKFVKTAPANYTGEASMGTTVCVSS